MAKEVEASDLIKAAAASLQKLDSDGLADAIGNLIDLEPNRWKHLLILSGDFWPKPKERAQSKNDSGHLQEPFLCLLKTFQQLLEKADVDDVQEMISTLVGSMFLDGYYKDILKELGKLEFTAHPPEVQIHRLLALVESQHLEIQKQFLEINADLAFIDVTQGFASRIDSMTNGTSVSLFQAIQSLTENVELGLRLVLHLSKNKLPEIPECQNTPTPIRNGGVSKYIVLSGIWRLVGIAWGNMRFRNWKWENAEGVSLCQPRNEEEFLRETAGSIRFHRMIQQSVLNRQVLSPSREDYQQELVNVSNSIVVPAQGEIWNGVLDHDALARLNAHSQISSIVEAYVDERHYRPIIEKVVAGDAHWNDWLVGKTILHSLADSMCLAINDQVEDSDNACLRQVVLVKRQSLVEIVEACTALDSKKATQVVAALQFSAERKQLEIWDQPLIPCGTDTLFLAPSIVMSGNPARTLENFVDQWGGADFGKRGAPFEKHIVDRINNETDGVAVESVKVPLDGEVDGLEFDAIMWWQGQLLLVELKCLKAIFTASGFSRAKGQIEYSVSQLIRRRKLLESVWQKIRVHERAAGLGLPEKYVGDDKVHCVSLTNIMEFTGYSRDGVVVTDENAFFRFFGERMVCVLEPCQAAGELKRIAELGPIRTIEQPTPHGLMSYLRHPVQMNQILNDLKIVFHDVPAVKEGDPGFGFVSYEFSPRATGAATPWEPIFVSEPAYNYANELCKNGGVIQSAVVQFEDHETVKELLRAKVVSCVNLNAETICVCLEDPIFARVPGRFAIGENALGQMEWWIQQQTNKRLQEP